MKRHNNIDLTSLPAEVSVHEAAISLLSAREQERRTLVFNLGMKSAEADPFDCGSDPEEVANRINGFVDALMTVAYQGTVPEGANPALTLFREIGEETAAALAVQQAIQGGEDLRLGELAAQDEGRVVPEDGEENATPLLPFPGSIPSGAVIAEDPAETHSEVSTYLEAPLLAPYPTHDVGSVCNAEGACQDPESCASRVECPQVDDAAPSEEVPF